MKPPKMAVPIDSASDNAVSVQVICPEINGKPAPLLIGIQIEDKDGDHWALFNREQTEILIRVLQMAVKKVRK